MIHDEIDPNVSLDLKWYNNCGYAIEVTVGDTGPVHIDHGRTSSRGSTKVTLGTATQVKVSVARPASSGGHLSKSNSLTWTADKNEGYSISNPQGQIGSYLSEDGISITLTGSDGIVILGTVDLPVHPGN